MKLNTLIEKLQKVMEADPKNKDLNVVFCDIAEKAHQFEMFDGEQEPIFAGRVSCMVAIQKEAKHIANREKKK